MHTTRITTNWNAYQTTAPPPPQPSERLTEWTRGRCSHQRYRDWIYDLFKEDAASDWYYTVINPELPVKTTNSRELYRHLTTCCERAMQTCDPAFPFKHPARYEPKKGIGLIWLPAIKHDDIHLHGWIRVNGMSSVPATTVEIRDQRTPVTITAPATVAALLDAFRTPTRKHWKPFSTTNVFVHHANGSAVAETVESLGHHLDYLRPVGLEQRLYGRTDAAPRWLFKQVFPSEVPR